MSQPSRKPQRSKYNRVQRDYAFPDRPKALRWLPVTTELGRRIFIPADAKVQR